MHTEHEPALLLEEQEEMERGTHGLDQLEAGCDGQAAAYASVRLKKHLSHTRACAEGENAEQPSVPAKRPDRRLFRR